MPSLASASHSVLANCHAITSRDAVLTLCSPRRRVLSSRTFQAPDATEHAGFSRAAVAASSSPCEISAVCVACSPLLMCVPRSSAPCCPSPSHVILQIIFVARLPRALRKIVLARPSWLLLSIPMLMKPSEKTREQTSFPHTPHKISVAFDSETKI